MLRCRRGSGCAGAGSGGGSGSGCGGGPADSAATVGGVGGRPGSAASGGAEWRPRWDSAVGDCIAGSGARLLPAYSPTEPFSLGGWADESGAAGSTPLLPRAPAGIHCPAAGAGCQSGGVCVTRSGSGRGGGGGGGSGCGAGGGSCCGGCQVN